MTKRFLAAVIITLVLASVSSAEVLARVNSQDITDEEVLEFIQPFGQQALMLFATEQGRKLIVDDVISMRLYALDGEAQKLDDSPEFQESLARARRAMLAQAAMTKVIEGITISDEEAKKFYDEHPDMFVQPERVHASHILVSDDETLAKVQADLKAGKSFSDVAKEYSIDPGSAANGGDLGEFPRGVMVSEFENAAFALKNPGDVSEPVKSQFGTHIIKLEEHIAPSTVAFEQVKSQIVQELQNQKTQEALDARSKELEEKYKVERF